MLRLLPFILIAFAIPNRSYSQLQVIENAQYAFPETIPAGNYSGITWLGQDLYVVVSDKSKEDGFFIFEIKLDMQTGRHYFSAKYGLPFINLCQSRC